MNVPGLIGGAPRIDPTADIAVSAVLHERVTVGARARIGALTVVGSPGFGYSRTPEGRWEHREHHGGVVIGDDVHVGASTCIDRATLEGAATVIGDGSKVDNLVHIAHNVQIGRDVLVIAHAMLAGSVIVGDGARIAPGAQVREHVCIGCRSVVGLGAVVLKDVPEFEVWAGSPARRIRDVFRDGCETCGGSGRAADWSFCSSCGGLGE